MLIRALFVAAPLYVLVQHIVTARIGEPYPAIALPAFGGHILDSHGEQRVLTPRITVAFADGTRAPLEQEVLFGQAHTLPLTITKWVFLLGRAPDGTLAPARRGGVVDLLVHGAAEGSTYDVHGVPVTSDPDFRDWLRSRLATLFPGRVATQLTVRWVTAHYALPGGFRGDDPTPLVTVTVPVPRR